MVKKINNIFEDVKKNTATVTDLQKFKDKKGIKSIPVNEQFTKTQAQDLKTFEREVIDELNAPIKPDLEVVPKFSKNDRILQIDDELEKLVAKEGKYGKMSRNDRENLMIKLQDESSTLQEKTLFKDSPEAIAKIKADNKAAIKRLKEKKIKSKEPVGLFANEQEFAEELSSIRGNLIKNDPDFNLEIAETYLKPGNKTYGWTPTGDESKLLSPKQRQKVLDNIRDVMKNDEYQYQFREDFDFTEMTDDMFRTDKASGGLARVGFAGGGILKEFIEKLFIKASNDIRQGKGLFKGLDQKQKMVQHDNLTKLVDQFQKTGNLIKKQMSILESTLRKRLQVLRMKVKKVDKNRKLTNEEWKDYVEENSYDLSRYEEELTGNETIAQLDDMIAESRAYEADMFAEYKSIGGSKRAGGPKRSYGRSNRKCFTRIYR